MNLILGIIVIFAIFLIIKAYFPKLDKELDKPFYFFGKPNKEDDKSN